MVLYPHFPLEVPDELDNLLINYEDISFLNKAITKYNDKKELAECYILNNNSSIRIWVNKIQIIDKILIINVTTENRWKDVIEDLYINKELKFILRGKMFKKK